MQVTGDRARWGAPARALLARHGRSLLLAAVALLVGLGVGRFLIDGDDPAPAASPAPASSPADRIASLEEATFARPDDPVAFQELGAAYVEQAAVTGDPAFYDLAQRAIDRAVALDPTAPDTLATQGALALSLHRFADALAVGERALDAQPGHRGALAVVVDAQVELGRYDDAAATLQQLLDIRPDLPALARTAYLRQLTGDVDGAVQAIRQARAAGDNLPVQQAQVMAIEGETLLLAGDPEAALEAFQAARRILPDLATAVAGEARALAATGDVDAAIELLADAVDRQPTPDAATLLGELQAMTGDAEAAAESFELARVVYDLQAASGQVVDLEGALFEADHGDPDAAVALAEAAFAERETVFTADALAWALHRAGRSAEAVPHATAAVARGAPEASIRLHAAAVLAAAGDAAAARTQLVSAAQRGGWLAPTLRPIAADLGEALDVEIPAAWR